MGSAEYVGNVLPRKLTTIHSGKTLTNMTPRKHLESVLNVTSR
jgi:hypothetical protein